MFNKNRHIVKKIRKSGLIAFLILQLVFLNSFTIYMSCFKTCCHTEKPVVHSCCSHKPEPAVKHCFNINTRETFEKSCNCYHAAENSGNYLVEKQYSNPAPIIDLFLNNYSVAVNHYPTECGWQISEVKTNSPPLYISNSVLII